MELCQIENVGNNCWNKNFAVNFPTMSAIRKLNTKKGHSNRILQMESNQMNICFIDSPFRIWQTVVGNRKSSKFKLQKAQM